MQGDLPQSGACICLKERDDRVAVRPGFLSYDRQDFVQVGSAMGETEEEIVMKKDLRRETEQL